MTDPLLEAAHATWDRIAADLAAGKPSTYRCTQHGVRGYCDFCEAEVDHAAATYDETTGRSRPLLRRRGR